MLFSGCSNQTASANEQYIEQIQALKDQVLELETQLEEKTKKENQLKDIAFDNRVYPGIYKDSEDKIVEKTDEGLKIIEQEQTNP